MREKREVQRSDQDLNLQFGSHDSFPDHTPSPDEHPEFGALPSPPPPDTPTPPPPGPAPRTTGHASSYLPHQQLAGQPLHYPSNSSSSSVNTTSSPSHFIGQPRPPVGHMVNSTHLNGQLQPHPSGSHMTESSSDSSVFAYGSSSDYTDSSSPSSQATPTGSGRSLKSTSSDGSSMNILHFSYVELSEATGGFTEGMVGIGAFGTVFRAKIRGNGPYAIKKLHTVS